MTTVNSLFYLKSFIIETVCTTNATYLHYHACLSGFMIAFCVHYLCQVADLFKGKMFVKNYRCELLTFLKMPLLLSSLIEHARLFSGLMTSHVILCTSLASSVINKMLRNVKKN